VPAGAAGTADGPRRVRPGPGGPGPSDGEAGGPQASGAAVRCRARRSSRAALRRAGAGREGRGRTGPELSGRGEGEHRWSLPGSRPRAGHASGRSRVRRRRTGRGTDEAAGPGAGVPRPRGARAVWVRPSVLLQGAGAGRRRRPCERRTRRRGRRRQPGRRRAAGCRAGRAVRGCRLPRTAGGRQAPAASAPAVPAGISTVGIRPPPRAVRPGPRRSTTRRTVGRSGGACRGSAARRRGHPVGVAAPSRSSAAPTSASTSGPKRSSLAWPMPGSATSASAEPGRCSAIAPRVASVKTQ
jgi:hypothetical protein